MPHITTQQPPPPQQPGPPQQLDQSRQAPRSQRADRRSRRALSAAQRLVVAAAAVPLIGIALTTIAAALGIISTGAMLDIALALGEEPGMLVLVAVLLCSPIQWMVGRTQVPVRKALGILFSGYAVANFAMFVIDEGLIASLSAPFLVAGTLAMAATIPLLITSGRWAQRTMGMKNWRKLHKLTYLIAIALVLHVALAGEIGLTGVMLLAALGTRIPPVASFIKRLGEQRHQDVAARRDPTGFAPGPKGLGRQAV